MEIKSKAGYSAALVLKCGGGPVSVTAEGRTYTLARDESCLIQNAAGKDVLCVRRKDNTLQCTAERKNEAYSVAFLSESEDDLWGYFLSRRNGAEPEFRIPGGQRFVLHAVPRTGAVVQWDDEEVQVYNPLADFLSPGDDAEELQRVLTARTEEIARSHAASRETSAEPGAERQADDTAQLTAAAERVREMRGNAADAAYLESLLREISLDRETLRHYATGAGTQGDAADRAAAAYGYAAALLAELIAARQAEVDDKQAERK